VSFHTFGKFAHASKDAGMRLSVTYSRNICSNKSNLEKIARALCPYKKNRLGSPILSLRIFLLRNLSVLDRWDKKCGSVMVINRLQYKRRSGVVTDD
jgi:hypothetical protein